MNYRIVSFYTEDTPYEQEVQKLIASVNRFQLPSHIKGVKNLGSWEKNCQYKANYILDALHAFEENIVWVDADAVFMKAPVLFDTLQCDIGYHYLPHRQELLSGTLFVRNNEKMKQVVQQWIEVNATNNEWDQKNLQGIVEADAALKKEVLPMEYCKIVNNRHQPTNNPVIMHYQASRRYKRRINGGRR